MRYGYWKSPEVPRTFQTICSGDWLGSSPHARRCRGCVRCPRTSKNRNAQRDVEEGNSKFVKSVSSECNLGILDFFSLTKFHLWVRNFREGKLFVRKSYCKQKMNLIIVFFYVIKSHKKNKEEKKNKKFKVILVDQSFFVQIECWILIWAQEGTHVPGRPQTPFWRHDNSRTQPTAYECSIFFWWVTNFLRNWRTTRSAVTAGWGTS